MAADDALMSKHNNQPNYSTLRLSLDEAPYTPTAKVTKMTSVPRTRFGWGRFTPGFLQVFNSPRWLLVYMCIGAGLAGAITFGFVPIILSTLEFRFGLSSTQSALLVITYDIFGVILIPVVTYYGGMRTARKGLWLGLGTLLFGVGCIIFSLPHFTTGYYDGVLTASEKNDSLCSGGDPYDGNSTNTTQCQASTDPSLSNYIYVFILAQLFLCACAGSIYTLGVAYLDESVEVQYSGQYIALLYAMTAVGPGLGTVVCEGILNLWVDWPNKTGGTLQPNDSNWLGNWWLGFPIIGCLGIVSALPLFGYPRKLPARDFELSVTETAEDDVIRIHEYNGDLQTESESKDVATRLKIGLRKLQTTLGVLFKNPTYMFLIFAGAIDTLGYSGIFTFSPKLSELMLDANTVRTSWYFGLAIVVGDASGALFGGWITKFFGVNCKKMLAVVVALSLLSQLGNLIFLMYCEDAPRVMLTQADSMNCTFGCLCDATLYDPVCGSNGVEYFSACHAGCTQYSASNLTYSSCGCITEYWVSKNVTSGFTSSAQTGTCSRNCFPWVMPLYFTIVTLLGFVALATIPIYIQVTLRIVPGQLRSFALGIQLAITKLLGLIPGSLIFGQVIDLSCIQWEDKCGTRGSCLTYDNRKVGLNVFAVAAVVGAVAMFLYFMAYWTYKNPKDVRDRDEEDAGNGNFTK
ncbi:solute carrier organic anion transporter family member 4A1-like isoform X1 [Branchiostoma lanceolatum]|uniref:solute carrier organic anion transporter family member 4A1-like isoform X1 n=1 Tax=Branchiostoma lanceolatum TaxID=7740 RepID=UPI00345177B2